MGEDDRFRNEILTKISEQTIETYQCLTRLDKKVDLHIQKTDIDLKNIKELDLKQNGLLEEHMKRSDQLERDNDLRERGLRSDFEDRFEKIEKPQEWVKTTAKVLFWIASAAGAIYGAYEFWTKLL